MLTAVLAGSETPGAFAAGGCQHMLFVSLHFKSLLQLQKLIKICDI